MSRLSSIQRQPKMSKRINPPEIAKIATEATAPSAVTKTNTAMAPETATGTVRDETAAEIENTVVTVMTR